ATALCRRAGCAHEAGRVLGREARTRNAAIQSTCKNSCTFSSFPAFLIHFFQLSCFLAISIISATKLGEIPLSIVVAWAVRSRGNRGCQRSYVDFTRRFSP